MNNNEKHIDKTKALALYSQGDDSIYAHVKELDNIDIYKDMVTKNFQMHLSNTYSLTKSSIEESKWDEMINQFILEGQPQSKLFWQMPGEFYQFATDLLEDWQADLMKFEWNQVKLFFAANYQRKSDKPFENDFKSVVELHDEWSIIELQYPVYKVKWENIEQYKGTYYLLQYRDQDNYEIENFELNDFLNELMKQLSSHEINLSEVLNQTLSKFDATINPQINEQYEKFIQLLVEKKIIIGILN